MTSIVLGLSVVVAGCNAPAPQGEMRSGAAVTTLPAEKSTDPSTMDTSTTIRTGPMTPDDPDRIGPQEQVAVLTLGESAAGVPAGGHAHGHSHGTGRSIELPILTGSAAVFDEQWDAAVASVAAHDTIEEAAALGYVRAAAPGPGVGTHWVLWSQIAKPFDPARPAMLLFDMRTDTPVLAGYSYWIQSSGLPVGFAGPNDLWHQHTGLCVVNGWVDREEADGPAQCAGTYLAGGDLWMLHAWMVPAMANRYGRFASINPKLCPPAAGTPDILRCPGT